MQCSQEQKQNNQGSSLVLVVAVMAIVGIFAVILLSLSLMNYRMKYVNLHSQDNFYDAEKVLDEIRTGLAVDVADAAGTAYQETLEQYSSLSEAERKVNYTNSFLDMLSATSIVDPIDSTRWNKDYLLSLVSAETRMGTKGGNGLKIESADGLFYLNKNNADGSLTIKKLKIVYIDANDYMTEIQTDIVISCPAIDYSQETRVPELTSYCIVAKNQTTANGLLASGVNIIGNAYLGDKGTAFHNSNISFAPNGDSGYVVTAGEMNAENGSEITASSGLEVWCRELYLSSSKWNSNETGVGKCKLYLSDDLMLANRQGTSVRANLAGEVYAYGNPSNVRSSYVYADNAAVLDRTGAVNFADDVTDNPADYSSAFLINGKNAVLNLSGVTKMQIAGNAYVATKKQGSSNQYDVMMGESVSLKSDQRAYLVPSEYFATECASGGVNPMYSTNYLGTGGVNGLVQEAAQLFGVTEAQIIADPTYLIQDRNGDILEPLKKAGVIGVRQAYYPIVIGGNSINMTYFFMVFENAEYARNYANQYFSEKQDALKVRISDDHYNTTVQYPNGISASDEYTFYYHGSILYADASGKDADFITGRCKAAGTTPGTLKREQNSYQEKFAALCHMLKDQYTDLSFKEKKQSIFDNLVDTAYLAANGSERIFTADSGEMAIVTSGNYEIDSTTDINVHVVIAGGTVRVSRSFTGLILAGNDVILANAGITVRSDSGLVKKALAGTNAAYAGIRPVNYLYGGEQYLNPSDREVNNNDTGGAKVNFMDSITYSNWKKQ